MYKNNKNVNSVDYSLKIIFCAELYNIRLWIFSAPIITPMKVLISDYFLKDFYFPNSFLKGKFKGNGIDVSGFPSSCQPWVCVTSTGECLKTSDIWALPKTNSFRLSGVDPIHLDILETPREIKHATKIENCQVCGQE